MDAGCAAPRRVPQFPEDACVPGKSATVDGAVALGRRAAAATSAEDMSPHGDHQAPQSAAEDAAFASGVTKVRSVSPELPWLTNSSKGPSRAEETTRRSPQRPG